MNIEELITKAASRVEALETTVKALSDGNDELRREIEEVAKTTARARFGPGTGDDGAEVRKAFLDYVRTGRESLLVQKSLNASADPEGGYLVPPEVDSVLTKTLRDLSPLRQLARVVNVSSGDFSMLHSTLGTGATWVGEKTSRPETTAPAFQKITPVVAEIYAMPLVTQQLLDDNAFDLENWLIAELSESFAAAEGAAFATGGGLDRPRGFLTYDIASTGDGTRADTAVQYVASGGAGAFASSNPSDKLISLVHALRPAYRRGAAWLMSTSTLEQIRTFKLASTGDYIWKPGLESGTPPTLLGFPIYEDPNMPEIAANSLSIAFGNWQRAYTIVDRSTSLLRDPYSAKPYVAIYCTKRVGGCIRDTKALKLMKFATS